MSAAKREWKKGNWRLNISHHHYRFHVLFPPPAPSTFPPIDPVANRKGKNRNLTLATLQFPTSHQNLITVTALSEISLEICRLDESSKLRISAFPGNELISSHWRVFYWRGRQIFWMFSHENFLHFRRFRESFSSCSRHATIFIIQIEKTKSFQHFPEKQSRKVFNIPFQFAGNVRRSAKKT